MSSAVSTATIDERAFARAFLLLLTSGSPQALPEDYSVDPATLGHSPFTPLPVMPNPKQKKAESATGTALTAKVTLKSIRAPKFFKVIEDASLSDTILHLKEALLKDKTIGLSSDISPDHIKFLVKGKVITDSKMVESIVSDDENGDKAATFTVMISSTAQSSPAPVLAEARADDGQAEPEPQPAYLAEAVWSGLKAELVKSVGASEAESIVSDCQKLVESRVSN